MRHRTGGFALIALALASPVVPQARAGQEAGPDPVNPQESPAPRSRSVVFYLMDTCPCCPSTRSPTNQRQCNDLRLFVFPDSGRDSR